MGDVNLAQKAAWSTAYHTRYVMNDLPNSAFLYVEPGEDDDDGRRIPRSKRHFPYKDSEGKIDLLPLQGALIGISQIDSSKLDSAAQGRLRAHVRLMLEAVTGGRSVEEVETAEWKSGAALDIRGVAYELTDLSEQVATELKAMTLLGTDTRQNGRMRPELLNQLKALQIKLAGVIEHAEFITAEQDGAAMVAHYRRQLDLLEV